MHRRRRGRGGRGDAVFARRNERRERVRVRGRGDGADDFGDALPITVLAAADKEIAEFGALKVLGAVL